MINILLAILVIVAVTYAAFWIIDTAGTPHPISMILKLIVGAIALISLLTQTGLLSGAGL
jgi:hypothetical protein